ncbi:MAG: Antitoxin component of toxin-antitoxin stability system, DNA-binding transcriptional repressor [Verrucomicrobia bacterium]|jgi:antitoxin (DNA-binding transcriptional repressor) of toxin-antitoxin stability system|nr:MAG: Antitoxin component of toxin-antitoxin stability system, DNA-binding transcriptional repressor [Verrucomicrobiota bacterium]
MKTATVADLRNNFRRISTWIEHGETVQIVKRGKVFAQLIATPPSAMRAVPKVDFMAQLKEIWGDRMFSDAEVEAMREAEREGDPG